MKTVSYMDYQASVEYEDGRLFVKVLHIDDLLIGECNAATDAPLVLKELIDEYLVDCAEEGRQPTKPFKGTFNVRISSELHRRAAMAAASEAKTLNFWIQSAIEEKLECSKMSDRLDGMFSSQRESITAMTLAQRWRSVETSGYVENSKIKKIRFEGSEETVYGHEALIQIAIEKKHLHA